MNNTSFSKFLESANLIGASCEKCHHARPYDDELISCQRLPNVIQSAYMRKKTSCLVGKDFLCNQYEKRDTVIAYLMTSGKDGFDFLAQLEGMGSNDLLEHCKQIGTKKNKPVYLPEYVTEYLD